MSCQLDTSRLVELLQQSAVEHLMNCRHLEVQEFDSLTGIITTDFEALYAYKCGEYQRCLQLSTHNVHTLLAADIIGSRVNSVDGRQYCFTHWTHTDCEHVEQSRSRTCRDNTAHAFH